MRQYGKRDWTTFWAFTITGLVVVVISVAIMLLNLWQCGSRANRMQVQWEWTIPEGCMIKAPSGQWVHIDRFRVLD